MTPHGQQIKDVLSALNTSEVKGLTSVQVAENTAKYGANKFVNGNACPIPDLFVSPGQSIEHSGFT